LAVCVKFGIDFLNNKTVNGNVLYIDQDTPTDILQKRFSKFIGNKTSPNKLYLHSNKDYEISDSFLEMIKTYNVKLIVIDCLSRLVGHSDINDFKDMTKLSIFKQKLLEELSQDVAIVIVHHTSDKKMFTLDEIMDSQDFGLFTFGSSVINQIADNIFLLYSPDKGKKILRKLYLRPIAKRFQINTSPMELKFVDKGNEMYLQFEKYYKKEDTLEKRIIETLTKSTDIFMKPRDIYLNIGLYSETIVRAKLREMISLNKINYHITRSNLHLISAKSSVRRKDYKIQLKEALEKAGAKNIQIDQLK
jgi:hypothetical protein